MLAIAKLLLLVTQLSQRHIPQRLFQARRRPFSRQRPLHFDPLHGETGPQKFSGTDVVNVLPLLVAAHTFTVDHNVLAAIQSRGELILARFVRWQLAVAQQTLLLVVVAVDHERQRLALALKCVAGELDAVVARSGQAALLQAHQVVARGEHDDFLVILAEHHPMPALRIGLVRQGARRCVEVLANPLLVFVAVALIDPHRPLAQHNRGIQCSISGLQILLDLKLRKTQPFRHGVKTMQRRVFRQDVLQRQ